MLGYVFIEERLFVAAPRQRVWSLLSDPEYMVSLSPELARIEPSSTDTRSTGATFRGHNRWGPLSWSTTNIVEDVEPDRVFAWRTVEGNDRCVSRWTYRLEDQPEGCVVTERYETANWMATAECLLGRRGVLRRGMRTTLRRMKEAVESSE